MRADQNTATSERAHARQPLLAQHGPLIQKYGTLRLLPLALSHEARLLSSQLLNQILADTMILYSLYKKHHWQMHGPTFYQLHLLLDKHAGEQLELIDTLAERVQQLGGVAIADPRHVAELTRIERPPDGVEEVGAMLSRLLSAHEAIITAVRAAIERTAQNGDGGSNDLLMGEVLRTHEQQVWGSGRTPGRHAAPSCLSGHTMKVLPVFSLLAKTQGEPRGSTPKRYSPEAGQCQHT